MVEPVLDPLPVLPCPHCGTPMDQGTRLKVGRPVYAHLKACPVLASEAAWEAMSQLADYQRTRRARRAQLPPALDGLETLPQYQRQYPPHPLYEPGLHLAEHFLRSVQQGGVPGTGFTLSGAPGVGKTTLLRALAGSLLQADAELTWRHLPTLWHDLTGALEEGIEDQLQELRTVPILCLDDLGLELKSAWWVDEVLFPIVWARYGARRPTLITTQFTWEALRNAYGREFKRGEVPATTNALMSRLHEQCGWVPLGKEDRRRRFWDFLPGMGR